MRVNDAITGLALIVFAVAVFYFSQGAPTIRNSVYGAALFPRLIAGLMGVSGFYMVAKEALVRLRGGKGSPLFSVPDWARSRWHVANFILVIASLVIYILFSDIIGFDLIGTIILFALFASLRKGHLGSSFVSALVATCIIHYVFGHFLRVPLPWGIFENYAFF
ncbi:MAG: tripartite tricarboxylate transporter TctB family protein [Thermoleophilia bacterium]|nr:tripartite tricarboxylate transporter TctB family protein [Thermoleophilia bacterium]